MLSKLRSRKAMKRVMFWTLILVIPSFVTFYGWQRSQDPSGRGEPTWMVRFRVPWVAFLNRWHALGGREQQLAEESITRRYQMELQQAKFPVKNEDDLRNLVKPAEVVDEAINDYLLAQLAQEKNLQVTNRELITHLRYNYLRGGVTEDQFMKYLESRGMTLEDIYDRIRRQQISMKAAGYIESRAKTSLFDLWQEYLIGNEKLQIGYVRVPTEAFTDQVKATTDSVRAFYQKHAENYRVPDKVVYRYLAIYRDEIAKLVAEPTTDSLKKYFEENKEKFRQPRSATVRHIFLSAAPDAPTSVVESSTKQIHDIETKIKAGADFAQLANQFSQDSDNLDETSPTIKHGGLLRAPITETTRSPFGPAFVQAALSLKKDEVSSPVRGTQGFHLIKADSATTGGIPALDAVAAKVRETAKDEKVKEEFDRRGNELRNLFAEKSFSNIESVAKATSLPLETAEPIEAANPSIPKLGYIGEDLEIIKNLNEGDFTEGVLKTPSAYFVLEVNKKIPSHIPPFDQVAKDVHDDFMTTQTAQLAMQQARELAKASSVDELTTAAKKLGRNVEQTDMVTRVEIENRTLQGLDPGFSYETIKAKVGTPHVTRQGSLSSPLAYVVWVIARREPPSMDEFRKQLPELQVQYLAQQQEALLLEWLHDARRKTRFEINDKVIAKEQPEKSKR